MRTNDGMCAKNVIIMEMDRYLQRSERIGVGDDELERTLLGAT